MSEHAASGGRLSALIERVRNEPGLGRNMISLAVIIALGLGVGGYILSQQRFNPPWEDNTFVYATFAEAPAIFPGKGQEVRVAGVKVGDIRSASVTRQGHALVLLAIQRDKFPQPVHRDATVLLRSKSPLNEMYVEMSPGSDAAPVLPSNGVLPIENSRAPIQVDGALGHLDDNARLGLQAMLSQSDQALVRAPQDLPAGLTATDKVVSNLRPVVDQLDARRDKIRQLITAVSRISQALGGNDERLATLATSLRTTLGTVSAQSDELRSSLNQLPGVTDRLRDSTGAVSTLSTQLDPTLDNVREASDSLPDDLDKLNGTLSTLDTTVDKAKPVAEKLRPVATSLRPLVADLKDGLPDLEATTKRLDPITGGLVPYLPDLDAFVYNTNSVVSLKDANGGILRGLLQVSPSTLPIPALAHNTPTPK